jgi:hypothetical protein
MYMYINMYIYNIVIIFDLSQTMLLQALWLLRLLRAQSYPLTVHAPAVLYARLHSRSRRVRVPRGCVVRLVVGDSSRPPHAAQAMKTAGTTGSSPALARRGVGVWRIVAISQRLTAGRWHAAHWT